MAARDWQIPNYSIVRLRLREVLFSQDREICCERGKRRQQDNIPFAGVIYSHQLRITIGQATDDLELIAKVAEPGDVANRIEFLPL